MNLYRCILTVLIVSFTFSVFGFSQESLKDKGYPWDLTKITVEEGKEAKNLPAISDELLQQMNPYLRQSKETVLDRHPAGGIIIKMGGGIFWKKSPKEKAILIPELPKKIRTLATCPDLSRRAIAFTKYAESKKVKGREREQVYYWEIGKKPVLITDGESTNRYIRWSDDGNFLAYCSNARKRRTLDVYVFDIKSMKVKNKLEKEGFWVPMDSWKSGQWLVMRFVTQQETYCYIWDPSKDQLKPMKGEVNRALSPLSSRNTDGVFFRSNFQKDFTYLYYFDAKKQKTISITEHLPHEVESSGVPLSGKYLGYFLNKNSMSSFHVMKWPSRRPISIPPFPVTGVMTGWIPCDDVIYVSLNASIHPNMILSINPKKKKPKWVNWSVASQDNQLQFSNIEINSFTSFDGLKIFYNVYRPQVVEDGAGPSPVLIVVHGGPESEARPDFSGWLQFLANVMKITVLEPNIRGSSGRGPQFALADNGENREKTVQDILKLREIVDKNPNLDGNRVGLIGGSASGYVVLSAIIQSNKFKCAISFAGVSYYPGHFMTMFRVAPDRVENRLKEYGRNMTYLHKISPLIHADEIQTPLMLAHGENDPRIVYYQSELIALLVSEQVPVWFFTIKDGDHGLLQNSGIRKSYWIARTAFIQKYLLGGVVSATQTKTKE